MDTQMIRTLKFISHVAAPRKDTNDATKIDGIFELKSHDIQSVLRRKHTLCEFIPQAAITKVYLDRDIYVDLKSGETAPAQHVIDCFKKEVFQNVQALVDMLETDEIVIDYVVATRHGPTQEPLKYKLSFRPFLQGMEIKYTHIPALIQAAGQEDFWDMTVYKQTEQLLAAIHGCKGYSKGYFDARVLEMEEEHDSDRMLEYIAQYTDANWPLLELTDEFVKEQREAAEARKATLTKARAKPQVSGQCSSRPTRGGREEDSDPEFAMDLVDCLNADSAADRTTWLKVAFGLKAAFGAHRQEGGGGDGKEAEEPYFQAWLRFSMKAHGKFKGHTDCRKTWDSIKTNEAVDGGIRIGTLCFYAARDNPDKYKELQRERMKRKEFERDSDIQSEPLKSKLQKTEGIRTDAVVSALRECCNVLQGLPDATKIQHNEEDMSIDFDGGNEDLRGTIQGKSGWTVHKMDGTFLGTICKDVDIPGSLGYVHKNIPQKAAFKYNRPSELQATLQADEPNLPLVMLDNLFMDNAFVSFGGQTVCTKTKVGALQKVLMEALHTHARKDFNIVQNNISIGTLNVNVKQSEFALIRVKLLDMAVEQGLRKLDGFVYERVPGCPCAYRIKCTYGDYINHVLEGDEVYLANPKRYKEAVEFMENYRVKQMPELVVDKDIISFQNGFLELSTATFTRYDGGDEGNVATDRVARHHIQKEFDGSMETPLLDKVLDCQFDKEVAQVLCALLGRLLFRVNQLDGWQVMPYVVGVGGTGKSLVLAVAEHMFAEGTVAYLAPKREDVFGMANACQKDLVVGRDMPAKLSGSLPQELMQAMTSGDGMEIPRKGTTSLNVIWKAAVIMASNYFPDYVNTGNNVGRRLVTFRFDRVVPDPEEGLLDRIIETEMPQIIARCLGAYSDLRKLVKGTKGGFWKAVPKPILEWQGMLASATNKLHAFLSMEDEERGCRIEKKVGHLTPLMDFKAAFEACMGHGFVHDVATFHAFGFRVSDKTEHVCKACKQLAKSRGGKCCEQYSQENRTKKVVVFDMSLAMGMADEVI